jgi:hypothetical protein
MVGKISMERVVKFEAGREMKKSEYFEAGEIVEMLSVWHAM